VTVSTPLCRRVTVVRHHRLCHQSYVAIMSRILPVADTHEYGRHNTRMVCLLRVRVVKQTYYVGEANRQVRTSTSSMYVSTTMYLEVDRTKDESHKLSANLSNHTTSVRY
jgi:hypothetical protein